MNYKDESEGSPPIFSLPSEIWEKIISFIDVEDIQSLENTCNFFEQFTKSPYIWKNQCLKSLYKKNVYFDENDIPSDLNFMSVHQRISTTSFLFIARSVLNLEFNLLISECTSVENLTMILKSYIHLKLRWSGETVNKDFINEVAFYKVCLDGGMTYMIMYTPFQIKKYDVNVLRNHMKHSVPVIFTQNTVRCIIIIPVMISPFLVGMSTYLIAQLLDNNFIFAIVINGNVQEQSYRHLSLPEEIQLINAVRDGTINIWINEIKEVLDLFTSEERTDCLLNFFVNYDSRNAENVLVLDIIKKKLTKTYDVHFEIMPLDFTDSNLKFSIECSVGILYEVVKNRRMCPANYFDPFKINVMDLREYIFYGTEII